MYKTFGALPHVGGVTWLDGEKFSMCRRGSKSVSTKASPHKGSKNKRSSPEKSCTAKASDVNKQAGASSNGLHEEFPALRSVVIEPQLGKVQIWQRQTQATVT